MHVLNWSPVEDLRNLRAAIISQSGCDAVSPINQVEALLAIHARRFDVLLLCDQTDSKTADLVCRYFRAANPTGRILVLDSLGRRRKRSFANVDAVIDAHKPEALVDAVCPPKKKKR